MSRVLLGASLCIFLLATLPLASAAAAAPALTPGDAFDTSANGSNAQRTTTMTGHADVQAIENVTVGGQAYDAFRVVTTSTFTSKTSSTPSQTVLQQTKTTTWTRVSDAATLKTLVETDTTTSVTGPTPIHTTQETDYDAPCSEIVFPLDVGATWATKCTGAGTGTGPSGTQHSTVTKSTSSSVLRKESVTVPAGTFDAYVIETKEPTKNGNTTTTTWWAPLACAAAKVQSNAGGIDTVTQLVSSRCAKASAGEFTPTPASTPGSPTSPASPTPAAKKVPAAPLALALVATTGAAILVRGRRG